jgi:hypothetical protein
MKYLLIGLCALLASCSTLDTVLVGLDAGCVDIEVRGYVSSSRADGRGIKVPEGTEVTPELIETLCGK